MLSEFFLDLQIAGKALMIIPRLATRFLNRNIELPITSSSIIISLIKQLHSDIRKLFNYFNMRFPRAFPLFFNNQIL